MRRSVIISINPKWCEKIAAGQKQIEIRKTRPTFETPFKCYIYQTKKKWYCSALRLLGKEDLAEYLEENHGQVIGEFVCDGVLSHCESSNADLAEQQGCIRREKLFEYSQGRELYGWHISDLVIYDKSKPLDWFRQCHKCPYGDLQNCTEHEYSCDGTYKLTRPPQTWCYVEKLL